MPVKAPALFSPVPVVQWTGFYVGAHVGGAWGYFRNNGLNIGPDESSGGYIAGGQLGYNWQSGRMVLGLEGDISAIDIHASTPAIGSFKENWTSTVRARVGYAVENYLAYLTGGVAFTHVEAAVTDGGSDRPPWQGPRSALASRRCWRRIGAVASRRYTWAYRFTPSTWSADRWSAGRIITQCGRE